MKKRVKKMKKENRAKIQEDFVSSLWNKAIEDMIIYGSALFKVSYTEEGCVSVKRVTTQELFDAKV